MMSTVPAIFSSEPMLDNDPFLASESDFMQWDCSEFFPNTQSIGAARSGFGSDEPQQNPTNTNSGSNEPNQLVPIIDERKRRRMISNRESARRSRMRKRNHLENLRKEVNQLRIENQELNNQLRSVSNQYHRLRFDNDRVRSEYSMLQQELLDMRRVLLFKQWQQFSSAWP